MGQPSQKDRRALPQHASLAAIVPIVSDHESDKAKQARLTFALMEPGTRSIKVVAEAVGVTHRTAQVWSGKYKWREFASRSDDAAYQRALTRVESERELTHLQVLRDVRQQVGRNLAPVVDKARDVINLPSTESIPVRDKKGNLKKDKNGKVEVRVIPINVGEHKAAADTLKGVAQTTNILLGEPDGQHKLTITALPDDLTEADLDDLDAGGARAVRVIRMIEVRGMYVAEDGAEDG